MKVIRIVWLGTFTLFIIKARSRCRLTSSGLHPACDVQRYLFSLGTYASPRSSHSDTYTRPRRGTASFNGSLDTSTSCRVGERRQAGKGGVFPSFRDELYPCLMARFLLQRSELLERYLDHGGHGPSYFSVYFLSLYHPLVCTTIRTKLTMKLTYRSLGRCRI